MSQVLSGTAFALVLISLEPLSFDGSWSLLALPSAPLSLLPVETLTLSPVPLSLLTHLHIKKGSQQEHTPGGGEGTLQHVTECRQKQVVCCMSREEQSCYVLCQGGPDHSQGMPCSTFAVV